MNQTAIFLPVVALAAWTLTVLLLIPYHRVRAALGGRLVADDFKLGESLRVPDDVRIPNRNLINLLEVPVLFYVACLSLHATGQVDAIAIALAWAYVVLRAVHSLIHLSYNSVMHRLAAYAASNLVLMAIWLRLFLALVA
jgi:hypothetical protein